MNMNRRRFCRSAVATGIAGALPAQVILGQDTRASKAIPSRILAVKLGGGATSIERAAIKELGESLQGSLLLNGDFGYDGARTVWNSMHDRFPALIVRAASAQDVSNAVTFASERELLLSVKGGGHSWPGRSVADDALMIDVGAIRDVSVDIARRRAKIGGGALLYNLDYATQRHGLATTAGVVSHTGVGGLTLGGGFGRLNRKFGLTIDNLVSAKMITADGQIRRVSVDENQNLFWAIRGGGGNYGVVTEFEFALHEMGPQVLGGDLLWSLDQARDLLEFYAEYSVGLSDELYVGPMLAFAPDGTPVAGMDICYCGDAVAGAKELEPLRQFGKLMIDDVAIKPYLTLQTRLDGIWHPGIRSYIKSGMVNEFTPALIDAMVESFDPTRGVAVGSHTAGGATARVDTTATAWPHRKAEIMILAVSGWTDPAEDEQKIEATRDQWLALEPHTSGYYENIQTEVSRVQQNFGPAHDRLVSIKKEFDPMNLFRLNSNIKPMA